VIADPLIAPQGEQTEAVLKQTHLLRLAQ
jgi:hypothetical protein